MARHGSFLGSVAKTILVGLVASYAIKFIQNRLDAMGNHDHEGESSGKDAKPEEAKA